MADLSPEVIHALVRLMKGEVDYDDLSDDDLFTLGAASRRARQTLHEITLKLRERGYTFAQIGERLGVTESTASRWVEPPSPPGRRPRGGENGD